MKFSKPFVLPAEAAPIKDMTQGMTASESGLVNTPASTPDSTTPPSDVGSKLSQGQAKWPFPTDKRDPANKVYGDPTPASGTPALHDQAVATGTTEAFGTPSPAEAFVKGEPVPEVQPKLKAPRKSRAKTKSVSELMPAATAPQSDVKEWKVVLHNNARTPYGNVEQTLMDVFKLKHDKASTIMYAAHNAGDRGSSTVVDKLTNADATKAADDAMKFAAKLPNGRGGKLRFSVSKM